MLAGAFRRPCAAGAVCDVDTDIDSLATVLATASASVAAGTTKVFIQNLDSSALLYWNYKLTAPSAKTAMGIIPAYQAIQLELEPKDLQYIWLTGDGAQKVFIYQEGI